MMGLGKTKLHTKFEVASFNHCRNIKKELQFFGSLPSPGPRPLSFGCDFMMGFSKPKLCTKFEIDSFSHCENIEGQLPNIGELP